MAEGTEQIKNKKREMFCKRYIVDFNATKAALYAGYTKASAKQQGHNLLQEPEVFERIQAMIEERAERIKVEEPYIVDGLIDCVERCLQRKPVMEFSYNDKEVVQVTEKNKDGVEVGVWQFNAIGALRGLELLGKYKAMFTDKHQHSGSIEITTEELESARRRVIELGKRIN